jgi:hypothetical protein
MRAVAPDDHDLNLQNDASQNSEAGKKLDMDVWETTLSLLPKSSSRYGRRRMPTPFRPQGV